MLEHFGGHPWPIVRKVYLAFTSLYLLGRGHFYVHLREHLTPAAARKKSVYGVVHELSEALPWLEVDLPEHS